jgi:hypothetical protein
MAQKYTVNPGNKKQLRERHHRVNEIFIIAQTKLFLLHHSVPLSDSIGFRIF